VISVIEPQATTPFLSNGVGVAYCVDVCVAEDEDEVLQHMIVKQRFGIGVVWSFLNTAQRKVLVEVQASTTSRFDKDEYVLRVTYK
jgi:hypothetical protein